MESTFSIQKFRLGILGLPFFQGIPFFRENFRSGRQNYSFHLHSVRSFRNFWANGKKLYFVLFPRHNNFAKQMLTTTRRLGLTAFTYRSNRDINIPQAYPGFFENSLCPERLEFDVNSCYWVGAFII